MDKFINCKICGNNSLHIIYNDIIRNGPVGKQTDSPVSLYQCTKCKTICHEQDYDYNEFYQTGSYRQKMGEKSHLVDFYNIHDSESFDKFKYTGTTIFRTKIVADIGCGGGAFMDYVNTVAKQIICIEPDEAFRHELKNSRGYTVFPYLSDALKEYEKKVDVVVSFDCIEHVDNPFLFIEQAWHLLRGGGVMIIGTPTDAPVMRELLGKEYEAFLFSTQHRWILNKLSFEYIARKIDIDHYDIKFYQRYGLGNALNWLINKLPSGHKKYKFISDGLDSLWRHELERQELADYIVFKCERI